jgi:predicted amidohydrolase
VPAKNSSALKRITAAAVQLEAEVGDVATNLERIERLVDEAAGKGAKLIAIPEFCTSRLPFDSGRMKQCCRRTMPRWISSSAWRRSIAAGWVDRC